MVRTLISMLAAVILLAGCNLLDNFNDERRTKKLVSDAVEVVEAEGRAAFNQFSAAPWVDGQFYLFIYQLDGTQIFHGVRPETNGDNRIGVKDENGVPVVANMVEIAKGKGRGWTDYNWPNPASDGAVEPKRSYVSTATMDGETIFIGSGYYIRQ